jgi:arginine/lysine/ornithine decarboxylase
MFQVIKSSVLKCSFLGLILLLSACKTDKEERIEGIQAAQHHQANNQLQAALAELEALNARFPKDSEILQLIGQTHAQLKDPLCDLFHRASRRIATPECRTPLRSLSSRESG